MLSRSHSIAVYTHTVKYALQKNNDDSLTEHLKKMVALFVAKGSHVATIVLEDRKTVNANWYTTVCLPQVITEFRKNNSTSGINVLKTGTNAWKSVLNIAKNSLKNNKW